MDKIDGDCLANTLIAGMMTPVTFDGIKQLRSIEACTIIKDNSLMPDLQNTDDRYVVDLSALLTSARHKASHFDAFPAELPRGLAQAYDVQMHSIAAWPENPSGWKVGGIPPALQNVLGNDRTTGPVFPSQMHHAENDAVIVMPVFENGFAAVESEFVYILGETITPGSTLRGDALLGKVSAMHIGIEIASSPLHEINTIGPLAAVCDFGNNAGLIIGPEVAHWRDQAFSDLTVSTSIDGRAVGANTADALAGGPLRSLEFLIEHCTERGIELPKGTAVTTGAVSGVHQIKPGEQATADFGAHGKLSVNIVAARPAATEADG